LLGITVAPKEGMRTIATRLLGAAVLSAALLAPIAITPTVLRAQEHQDRAYHDKEHNDDHHWNDHEDKAYDMYLKENHRKHVEFVKLKDRDQQNYWKWRHEHSDALLKIDIH
jgi:hypothetical protein